jgi:hypothetical protein
MCSGGYCWWSWSVLPNGTAIPPNVLLGTQVTKHPSDSTFRLLFAELDIGAFEALLQQRMAGQPGVSDTDDTLDCDGKTLSGTRHARSGTGGGELAGERHDFSGALQGRPRGQAH